MLDYNIAILYRTVKKNLKREKGEFRKTVFITINELTKTSGYVAFSVLSLTSPLSSRKDAKGKKGYAALPAQLSPWLVGGNVAHMVPV